MSDRKRNSHETNAVFHTAGLGCPVRWPVTRWRSRWRSIIVPEVTALGRLCAAIDKTGDALYTAHPSLAETDRWSRHFLPEHWLSETIIVQATALRSLVNTYDNAVALHEDLGDTPDDSFPF